MIINDVIIRPSPLDENYLIKNQDRIQIGPEKFVYLDKSHFQKEKNVDPGGPSKVDSSSSLSESELPIKFKLHLMINLCSRFGKIRWSNGLN